MLFQNYLYIAFTTNRFQFGVSKSTLLINIKNNKKKWFLKYIKLVTDPDQKLISKIKISQNGGYLKFGVNIGHKVSIFEDV